MTISGVVGRAFAAVLCIAACGKQGTVTFTLEAPTTAALSPLTDARRDVITISDEKSGSVLANASALAMSGSSEALGNNLPVGNFDLRLQVTGGALLLGLARTRDVDIIGLQANDVTLHVRKPIAFFGASRVLGDPGLPGPGSLMTLDTTLPPSPILDPVSLGSTATASASTHDGQFVLVGAGSTLAVIDTRDDTVKQMGGAPGAIGAIAVSADDKVAAIVSSSGVSLIGDLQGFIANGGSVPAAISLSQATRAVFSPDGSTLTVLTGPTWDKVDCTKTQNAATYAIPVAAGTLGPKTAAPNSATGITYGPGGALILSSPCAAGAMDGDQVALSGKGIYQSVPLAGGLAGVLGDFTTVHVDVDPDDPSLRNVDLPFGQIALSGTAGGKTNVNFIIPSNRFEPFGQTDPSMPIVQIRLVPKSPLVAYEAAASADGARVVFNSRIHYGATAARYVEVDFSDNTPAFFCEISVQQDVYRVTEIDTTTGTVGYQSTVAIDTGSCTDTCTDCTGLRGCMPSTRSCISDAGGSTGYVPAGLSILMGTP